MVREQKFEDVMSRVKQALGVITDGDLAKELHLSQSSYANRKKRGTIPYEELTEVTKSRNVNLHWVLTGSMDGTQLREASVAAAEVAIRFSRLDETLIHEMQEAAFTDHLNADQLLERFRHRLPVATTEDGALVDQSRLSEYQLVPRSSAKPSAGHGTSVVSEQIVDFLAFKRDWLARVVGITHPDVVLVEVRGDSMLGTLDDGDLALVDMRQNRLDVSAIFVIQVDDALLVKRVQRKLDGSVAITSDNKAYEPEILRGSQLDELRIIGRVVWPRIR